MLLSIILVYMYVQAGASGDKLIEEWDPNDLESLKEALVEREEAADDQPADDQEKVVVTVEEAGGK